MQKIILLLLALAVMATAIPRVDTFSKCSAPDLIAPGYGFEEWTAKCWADNTANSDLTSGKPDAAMCACYNKFSDVNMARCSTAAQFEYKAYLKNACAPAAKSTWTPPAKMVGVGSTPPCIQTCALTKPNIDDVCSIAEECTDISTCHWDEALHLHSLEAECRPNCVDGIFNDCITANKLQSATTCETLEVCQPVDYVSPYQYTIASVPPGPGQQCAGDAASLVNKDIILDYRRATCACPHGTVKSANGKRCDPRLREATVITVSQQLRSNDGNLEFWKTNTALQDKIRLFIGRRIFATDTAKAAGIFENDPTNLKAMVKITKIELAPAVKTTIAQSRRALAERELVQGAAPAKNAGEGTGTGVKITYSVSVENKGSWPILNDMSKDNSIQQNIQQYVNDVVSYAPLKNTVGYTRPADLLAQAKTAASKHTAGLTDLTGVFTQSGTNKCYEDKLATITTKCLTTTAGSGANAEITINTDANGLITALSVTAAGTGYTVGDKLILSTNGDTTILTLTKVGVNGEVELTGDAAFWASPKDVTSSFAEGLTSEIKSTAACGVNFIQPCLQTWAAFTDHPSAGVVTVERFSPPTAAPTFAPTPRAAYVASPIVMFSVAGGAAVLLFGFFCIRAHVQGSSAKKTEMVTQPAAAAKASAPAPAAAAVMPPPAPTNAEVAAKEPVKAGRA